MRWTNNPIVTALFTQLRLTGISGKVQTDEEVTQIRYMVHAKFGPQMEPADLLSPSARGSGIFGFEGRLVAAITAMHRRW